MFQTSETQGLTEWLELGVSDSCKLKKTGRGNPFVTFFLNLTEIALTLGA